MKKIYIAIFTLLYTAPAVVSAAETQPNVKNLIDLLGLIKTVLTDYIIPIIMGIAVIVFLWGIVKFIKGAADPDARSEGRQLMLWGIIGLTVMVSVWGLVGILAATFNLPVALPTTLPTTK